MPFREDDFESFWQELQGRTAKALITISTKPRDYTFGLEEAAAKAEFDLRQDVSKEGLTKEDIPHIVSRGVQYFMRHWYDAYRNQDVAGLVEFILAGLDLPTEELHGMMKALPRSLIDRVVRNVSGAGTGIHALFALEWHWREGNLPNDYEIYRDDEGLKVRLVKDGESLTISLDEVFQLDEKPELSESSGPS